MKLFLFFILFICTCCAAYMQSATGLFKYKVVAHKNSLLDKFQHYRRNLPTYLKATRKTTVRKALEFQNGMPITSALIFANVVVYALTKGIPGLGWIPLFKGNPRLLQKLMKINVAIDRGQVYRLLTSCFCHGSLMHLFSNCISLSSIGPETERLFGPLRFLIMYVGSGVLADVSTYLLRCSPYSLGASGCVFGLVGAMAAFYYSNRAVLGRRSAIGLESIKRTMIINLLYGMSAGNVDNAAHLGGAIFGGLLSLLLGPRLFYGSDELD